MLFAGVPIDGVSRYYTSSTLCVILRTSYCTSILERAQLCRVFIVVKPQVTVIGVPGARSRCGDDGIRACARWLVFPAGVPIDGFQGTVFYQYCL